MKDIGDLSRIRIGKSPHGLGLFAVGTIPKGSPIMVFTGEVMGLEDVLASGVDECYPLQLGPRVYLDLDVRSRVVNHSCEPNAGLRSDRILVALRDIASGEEIVYDYSTTMSERRWTMACNCHTAGCRGTVGDFHDLPPALQRRYLALGVVQAFIVQEVWFGRESAAADALAILEGSVA